MFTLLVITLNKKIILMHGLWHWKLEFKFFPTVYYMLNSDNRASNGDHQTFAVIVSQKSRLDFLVVEVNAVQAFAFGIPCEYFPITLVLYFFSLSLFLINFLGLIQGLKRKISLSLLQGVKGGRLKTSSSSLLPTCSFIFLYRIPFLILVNI